MRLATRDWGEEGRRLAVLVHGVTDSSRAFWRVGPWFAEAGWQALAVDLRGHGASPPMRGGEGLEDLAGDLRETLEGLLDPGERADVLLGHSLSALTALKFCELYGGPVGRLVLVDPHGSASTDFGEVARSVEARSARAEEAPEAAVSGLLVENPSWAEEDARNEVAGHRECDAGPVAAMVRDGLRYDLAAWVGALEGPTLLVLGGEGRGSALPEPERSAVAGALRRDTGGAVGTLDTGHNVDAGDFAGYVRLLGGWLGEPRP